MDDRPPRFDRAMLYVPATRPNFIERGIISSAFQVIICLEDGTPEHLKDAGRHVVVNAIDAFHGTDCRLAVRINHPDTEHGLRDIEALAAHPCDVIRIPKVQCAEDLELVESMFDRAGLEPERRPRYEAMIESIGAIDEMEDMVRRVPRVDAFTVGGEDLRADIAARADGDVREYGDVLRAIVLGSVRASRPIYDTTFWPHDDREGLEETSRRSRDLGFAGRSAIHPQQLSWIQAVYATAPVQSEGATCC